MARRPRAAGAARAGRRAHRRAARAAEQDRLHRPQLPRPRRGEQDGPAEGAGHVLQGDDGARRPERSGRDPARRHQAGLGSRARRRHRRERASYVDEARALEHVAGYALHNDYSERAFQLERGGQWVKGKSADTFAPIGPFLATRDEIADPQALGMWLTVNGDDAAEGHDREHGLRRADARQLRQPVHDAAAGRRDQHRHAGRASASASSRRPSTCSPATSSSSASTASAARGRKWWRTRDPARARGRSRRTIRPSIEAYKEHHRRVWPEVLRSLRARGARRPADLHARPAAGHARRPAGRPRRPPRLRDPRRLAPARRRMGSADEIDAAAGARLRAGRMVGGDAAGLPSP